MLKNYLHSLPEEVISEIYKKIFNNCLAEMVRKHNIKNDSDCVCSKGIWCEECYGEYDLFD